MRILARRSQAVALKPRERVVGILRNYPWPDLRRQLPEGGDCWDGVRFVIDEIDEPCDVVVVLNKLNSAVEVDCGEVWQIVQEPPVARFPWIFEGRGAYAKVFSPHKPGDASHGALPWHVNRSFSELTALEPPEKARRLSWITSNKRLFSGHDRRLRFLESLRRAGVDFDLYGRGFREIEDKFDGLSPYRYSLAVENHEGPGYWTEKVADCFLSWTMPIYFGCTNLADYFPAESFVPIDISDPRAPQRIQEIAESDLYLSRRDAIAEARRRVLQEHQLFPFIVSRLPADARPARRRRLPAHRPGVSARLRGLLSRVMR